MYIKSLKLENIGPFKAAELSFPNKVVNGRIPITIITGNNGAGKSIIIDAIRAIFKGAHGIERDIIADKEHFSLEMTLLMDNKNDCVLKSGELFHQIHFMVSNSLSSYFVTEMDPSKTVNWVVDYWDSSIGTDGFSINSLSSINVKKALVGALDGKSLNVELVKFICSVDYLRSSEDEKERKEGEQLYSLIKSIIEKCLENGKLVSVSRKTFEPQILVNGNLLTLQKLSSGSFLLIKRLIGLISRMYGICDMNKLSIKDMKKMSGVLLIDEIENHLHPNWQKRVLDIIQSEFPLLQIILTTHSPFVVSSTKDATVYVCKSIQDGSIVEDESEDYSNLPVDEVLNKPVFSVGPFSDEITELLQSRKDSLKKGDLEKAEEYAQKLLDINPNYFTFYKQGDKSVFYDK